MAKLYKLGDFIGPGEERTAAHLERTLPTDWAIICNKELVNPDGSSREVDFIVVGKRAVFVIEEKSWSGAIHGNENGWILHGSESFPSPLRSVQYLAKRLAGLLRAQILTLKHEVSGHFVHSGVILSSDSVQVFVREPRVADQVWRLEECAEELTRSDRLHPDAGSIAAFRDQIIRLLTKLPDRPNLPRRIGDYKVLEPLPAYGPIRVFRAQHIDGTERFLKLIPRPTTLRAEEAAAWEAAGLREYEVLRNQAATDLVPSVDPRFSWDQDQFWVYPIHPMEGRSLRADRAAAAPTAHRARAIFQSAFSALGKLHDSGVVHRGINPDRVYIGSSEGVVFSDFIIARVEGCRTIASEAHELDPYDAYRAPECRVDFGLAEKVSDVYSLTASFLYWLTGNEPQEGDVPYSDDELAEASSLLGIELESVLAGCLAKDERERPSVSEILQAFQRISVAIRLDETEKGEFDRGHMVDSQHRIVRVLGRGGSAVTYLALDLMMESHVVLKTILDPELISKLARTEFKSLTRLSHPCLPKVYDIRPPDNPFHLKLEYVEGTTLRDMMQSRRGDKAFALRIATELLSVLAYLHDEGVLHRDLSTGNIMVPDEGNGLVKLIDFGLASSEVETRSSVGTPRYRAPEIDSGGKWTTAADLYSCAAIVYELLVGRLPYAIEDGSAKKNISDCPLPEEREAFGSALLDLLLTATSYDPAVRPQKASELSIALQNAAVEEHVLLPGSGERIVNPFVNALRRAYRNSRLGNSENRGLDTDFSIETYIETRLDRELLPQILAGEYLLVVLSGNPGDGKTAFLQRLYKQLEEIGCEVEDQSASGWRVRLENHVFSAVYDASESDGERSADQLVHEALKPLSGHAPADVAYTAVIAANDGRLLDFLEREGERYPWLSQTLNACLDGKEQADGVVVVDLKRRALVSLDPDAPFLAGGLLQQFTAPERWSVCENCIARVECPIRFNALTFHDGLLGLPVREQMHRMLLGVHLRRERRATIRDLRSALAFLITHDVGCEEIHSEHDETGSKGGLERLYFQAAFSGAGCPDLLLDEWRHLDPSMLPSPRLDRFFYFHRARPQVLTSAFISGAERSPIRMDMMGLPDVDAIKLLKRRYFFEGNSVWHDALGSPPPGSLLPYRHFETFIAALRGELDHHSLIHQLFEGISHLDGVPFEAAAAGGLAVRVSDSDVEDLTVIKRFPREEFELLFPETDGFLSESTPDQLTLTHTGGLASLAIGLDLFELLARAANGSLPGPEEQGALAEELTIFKNQLLSQYSQEVVLLEDGQRATVVRVESGSIIHEAVTT